MALLADLIAGAPARPFAGLVARAAHVGSWACAGRVAPARVIINDTSSASVSWPISFVMCFLPVHVTACVTARGWSAAVSSAGRIHTPHRFAMDDLRSGIACLIRDGRPRIGNPLFVS